MAWLNNAKWIYQSLWHSHVSQCVTHKKGLGWDSSNSTQASSEEAFPQSCVCLQGICIYFIISGYRKQSQVGMVVPELGAQRGKTKTKKLLLPKVLCDQEKSPSDGWLPQSHPLSWNVKHTWTIFYFYFLSLPLSFLTAHLHTFTNWHTYTHLYRAEQMSESWCWISV